MKQERRRFDSEISEVVHLLVMIICRIDMGDSG